MAITLADFTKIWASTSPLTPYSFSESNYKEGWNFIGGTPPSRQMWDSIQKQNDEKLKYIVDNFLPLDGGTMDAPIGFNAQGQVGYRGTTHTNPSEVCRQLVATAGTVDSAWDDGNAKLCLHTYDDTGTNTAEDGGFALQTSDGNGNSPYLEGKPNGDLKWSSKSIERVNSSASEGGAGYIRYENGLQICWGTATGSGDASGKTVTFPVAFNASPSVQVISTKNTATANPINIQVIPYTTNFVFFISINGAWTAGNVMWLATGTWK